MNGSPEKAAKAVISAMPYRDVTAAVEWLCRAFGFEKHRITKAKSGRIHYAELSFGGNIIALGSIDDPQFGKFLKHPKETGGLATQSCYLVVGDADAHYTKARAAGARIIVDIGADGDGGRCFACRDLEGHIWTVGTYRPRTTQHTTARPSLRVAKASDGRSRSSALISAVLVIVIASAATVTAIGWMRSVDQQRPSQSGSTAAAHPSFDGEDHASPVGEDMAHQLTRKWSVNDLAQQAARAAQERLDREQRDKDAVQRATSQAKAELDPERAAREVAERGSREALEQLARERVDREITARAAGAAEEKLAAEQAARLAAERTAKVFQERLTREEDGKDVAERTIRQLQAELIAERAARDAAERVASEARQVRPAKTTLKRTVSEDQSAAEFRLRPRVP